MYRGTFYDSVFHEHPNTESLKYMCPLKKVFKRFHGASQNGCFTENSTKSKLCKKYYLVAVLWYVDVSMPMDTDSVTKITYN